MCGWVGLVSGWENKKGFGERGWLWLTSKTSETFSRKGVCDDVGHAHLWDLDN